VYAVWYNSVCIISKDKSRYYGVIERECFISRENSLSAP
jgi:hypothetical protein